MAKYEALGKSFRKKGFFRWKRGVVCSWRLCLAASFYGILSSLGLWCGYDLGVETLLFLKFDVGTAHFET